MISYDDLPLSPPPTYYSGLIQHVHHAFLADGSMLVPHGSVYFVPTDEVAEYRKLPRMRENALAPGRKRNRNEDERRAGQRKWDELVDSMGKRGFLPEHPVEFIISANPQLRLYQGHHRIGVALALRIPTVPVLFWFEHLWTRDTTSRQAET